MPWLVLSFGPRHTRPVTYGEHGTCQDMTGVAVMIRTPRCNVLERASMVREGDHGTLGPGTSYGPPPYFLTVVQGLDVVLAFSGSSPNMLTSDNVLGLDAGACATLANQ